MRGRGSDLQWPGFTFLPFILFLYYIPGFFVIYLAFLDLCN